MTNVQLALPASSPPVGLVARAAVKRAIDVVVAATVLVLSAPMLVLAVVAMAIADPGPVLFRHRRIGRDGRPFHVLKLRTMAVDAEARLLAQPELHARYVAAGYKLPAGEDPRICRVGRLLRTLSVDELPQLVNVLRGDMALVGPRPVLAPELDLYASHGAADAYLGCRPGVTGLWQVSGRSRLSYPERIALDRAYLDRPSLVLDLAILAWTPVAVLRRDGAC